MTNTIETTIVNALKTHGWFVRHGAAIATKIFDTCVGEKEAFVYLLNLKEHIYFYFGWGVREPGKEYIKH